MYEKSLVKLIIEKIDASINFRVGVKQGNIMEPFIFMFLMMLSSKTQKDK